MFPWDSSVYILSEKYAPSNLAVLHAYPKLPIPNLHFCSLIFIQANTFWNKAQIHLHQRSLVYFKGHLVVISGPRGVTGSTRNYHFSKVGKAILWDQAAQKDLPEWAHKAVFLWVRFSDHAHWHPRGLITQADSWDALQTCWIRVSWGLAKTHTF